MAVEIKNSESVVHVASAATAEVVLNSPATGHQYRLGWLSVSSLSATAGSAVIELWDGTNAGILGVFPLDAAVSGIPGTAFSLDGNLPFLTAGQSLRVRGLIGAIVTVSYTEQQRTT